MPKSALCGYFARGKEVGDAISVPKRLRSKRHETLWYDLETISSLVLNGSQWWGWDGGNDERQEIAPTPSKVLDEY